ncbi:hypothetical protein RSAG8_02306, partial [Rhizoctonia solani AG-8 WAC10335]
YAHERWDGLRSWTRPGRHVGDSPAINAWNAWHGLKRHAMISARVSSLLFRFLGFGRRVRLLLDLFFFFICVLPGDDPIVSCVIWFSVSRTQKSPLY